MVELQVHVEADDEHELGCRERQQQGHQECAHGFLCVEEHLGDRDDRQDDAHQHIRPRAGMGMFGGVFFVRVFEGRHQSGIRYTRVKIRIHTISTKCQYRPAISTSSECSWCKRPLNECVTREASQNTPMNTWVPWKPVRVKKVDPSRLLLSVKPSR